MASALRCDCGDCRRPARWRPVLLVPLDEGEDTLAVPLPIEVCWRHRLPKHGWSGLRDPHVLSALDRMAGPHQLAVSGAWITHVRLQPGASAGPPARSKETLQ